MDKIQSKWEEMSYYKYYPINSHNRLKSELDDTEIDNININKMYNYTRPIHKVKIGYHNIHTLGVIYDSELNYIIEEIYKI